MGLVWVERGKKGGVGGEGLLPPRPAGLALPTPPCSELAPQRTAGPGRRQSPSPASSRLESGEPEPSFLSPCGRELSGSIRPPSYLGGT